MILIACSSQDIASRNAAQALILRADLSAKSSGVYENKKLKLQIVDSMLPKAQNLDTDGAELIIFMSRHSSASGVGAFTVHPTGNWTSEVKLGGLPQTLSVAAPSAMLGILRLFEKSLIKMEVTYEATHHGPTLSIPSLFAEFGGNEETISNEKIADELARVVYEYSESMKPGTSDGSTVVLGVGGTHYPRRFTELALRKGYAFSHIMPKHAILNLDGTDNIGMLDQAVQKSSEKIEKAIIDWKSINSLPRSNIIKKLNEMGVDYERI